jgi:hypothetical protein
MIPLIIIIAVEWMPLEPITLYPPGSLPEVIITDGVCVEPDDDMEDATYGD